MANNSFDARTAFEDLASEGVSVGRRRAIATGVVVPGGDVLCALDPAGRRMLLVPTQRVVPADHSSAGISLATTELDDDSGERRHYLVMACEVASLADLFASVTNDAVDAVEADPANAEHALQLVVDRYRQLFARRRGSLLDGRQLASLLAELLVVEHFVAAGGPVEAWTGPDKDRHDLRGAGGAIEVKSTLSAEHRKFVVHGEKQLESPPSGPLFLHLVRVEAQLGGVTVPEVVRRVRDELPGSDAALLGALAKVGYRLEDEHVYNDTGFSVLREETHLVDADFPKLTSETTGELPGPISGLRYTVDLAAHPRAPFEGGIAAAVSTVLGEV